jgi:hypothetical protein
MILASRSFLTYLVLCLSMSRVKALDKLDPVSRSYLIIRLSEWLDSTRLGLENSSLLEVMLS